MTSSTDEGMNGETPSGNHHEYGHRTFFTYYQSAELETALRHAGFHILETWEAADQAGRDELWLNLIAEVDSG